MRVILEALVSNYQAKMAAATASTTAFGASALKSAHQHQQAFNTLGLAGLAIGAGIGFAFKAAADAAMAFESSFAGVRKTVDASEAEFDVLAQGLRDMAKTMPINVNELNRIAEAAGQLGVEKEAILGFTETIAKLGVTTNITGDEAATAFARIANVMQTPQDQFDRMGATVVALGNAGASTEADIVEMAMRIAGAGQVIGLTEAEVLGFSNALSSVGIEAQMGGSAISRVFIDIANNVESGGGKLETFAEVAGMTADEFSQAFEQDAAGAMVSFIEGLGRIDAAGGNVFAVLEQLGLSEVRVRDTMLRAAGAGDLFRESIELGSRAWEENTALNEEAAKRFDTTASKVQIATNRINDMAISFGSLLLPAIAAAMGAVGDIADLIGGLPAPAKAVAIAIAAIAAGMALLSGATLLLLPRIAAVKLAMAQMGLQGGILRGSLALAAKAINPLTIGLAAAAIGLTIFAQEKANAKARVEEFTSAIENDTGALGENTRAVIINQLQQEGLLGVMKDMGVSTEEAVDNLIGLGEGNKQATAATIELMHAMGGQDAIKFAQIIQGLQGGVEAYGLKTEAAGNQTERTADAIDNAGTAVDDLGVELEETVSLTDQLTQALDELAGTAITVNETQADWLDSLADLNEELSKGKKTLDINTQAGRDNQAAIRASIQAAFDHGAAVAEETGSVEAGARAVRKHIVELMEQAEAAGISKEDIKAYIRELNLTPEKIKTLIQLLGVDTASNQMSNFFETWNGRTINVQLGVTTPSEIKGVSHAGGIVGASSARRMHGGGMVRGDEVPIIAQRGERILSRAQNRAYEGRMWPASAGGGGGDVVVNLTVNGSIVGTTKRELATLLADEMHNALLRKQKRNVSLGTT